MNQLSLNTAKAKNREFAVEGGTVDLESKIDMIGEPTYLANDIDSKMQFEEL